MTYTVTEVALADIMQLRVAVLRKGTPATDCNYPEDAYPDVVHFAIFQESTAIATSSWFMKECPEKPGVTAMQLKGMAVADELQGEGLRIECAPHDGAGLRVPGDVVNEAARNKTAP